MDDGRDQNETAENVKDPDNAHPPRPLEHPSDYADDAQQNEHPAD